MCSWGDEMAWILAVDDEPAMLDLIRTALEREGHTVMTAESAAELSEAKLRRAELILLDVMMPGEDGFSLCARLRERVDCPILFLTARDDAASVAHGLGIGGDDYVVKPFRLSELRARVAAHLRRETRVRRHALTADGLLLDIAAREASCAGTHIPLTRGEFDICVFLLEHRGQVFSKEQILEAVFGLESASDASAIAEHVKNIRAKLRTVGREPIETVWGVGYKWSAERA